VKICRRYGISFKSHLGGRQEQSNLNYGPDFWLSLEKKLSGSGGSVKRLIIDLHLSEVDQLPSDTWTAIARARLDPSFFSFFFFLFFFFSLEEEII